MPALANVFARSSESLVLAGLTRAGNDTCKEEHSMGHVWRKNMQVGGVLTEFFGVTAGSSPKVQVFVISGNPGSAAYFEPLLRYLDEHLGGEADILAPTHAGHDPRPDHDGKLWTLEEQIQHKMDALQQYMLVPGRPPVVVLGHSIGAYMMLNAVHRLEKQLGDETNLPRIVKLVGLMPFLETDFRILRQKCLRISAACYELLGWVAWLMGLLPRSVNEMIVRYGAKDRLDPWAERITCELLSRPTIRNNFFLAMHEFKDLSRPAPWHLLQSFGDRLHIIGCPHDTWLSRELYDFMLQMVPGIQATWEDDLRHAFVVSTSQSIKVARMVAGWVHEALGVPGAGRADQVLGGTDGNLAEVAGGKKEVALASCVLPGTLSSFAGMGCLDSAVDLTRRLKKADNSHSGGGSGADDSGGDSDAPRRDERKEHESAVRRRLVHVSSATVCA